MLNNRVNQRDVFETTIKERHGGQGTIGLEMDEDAVKVMQRSNLFIYLNSYVVKKVMATLQLLPLATAPC